MSCHFQKGFNNIENIQCGEKMKCSLKKKKKPTLRFTLFDYLQSDWTDLRVTVYLFFSRRNRFRALSQLVNDKRDGFDNISNWNARPLHCVRVCKDYGVTLMHVMKLIITAINKNQSKRHVWEPSAFSYLHYYSPKLDWKWNETPPPAPPRPPISRLQPQWRE